MNRSPTPLHFRQIDYLHINGNATFQFARPLLLQIPIYVPSP